MVFSYFYCMEPTDKYKTCNHYHELTEDYEIVDFGDGTFIANKQAIPLLKALNEAGLRTRTHHIANENNCFVSILLPESVQIEIRTVNEIHADRTKYNGQKELLIQWTKWKKPSVKTNFYSKEAATAVRW